MSGETVLLDGETLTVSDVVKVARDKVKVEVSDQAMQKVKNARDFVSEQILSGVPVYGFNRGVGLNKDQKVAANQFTEYNHNLILSHCIAIGEEASEEDVRAAMLIRLNTLLLGFTGAAPDIVNMYRQFLNRRICPAMPETGSVGAADIGCLSFIGLAMIGEGTVYYRGLRMSSKEALEKAGLKPIILGPKDGLAIVSSNAFAIGKAALLAHNASDLVDTADMIYALSLEGLNGNVTPLNQKAVNAKKLSGQKKSAKLVCGCLKNSYLWTDKRKKSLQDPLSFRGAFSIHGSVREAIQFVKDKLTIFMNASDDNPLILLKEKKIISCANYEITSLVIGIEMLGIALSHLSKIACYRIIKLGNPQFTGLTRFLVPKDKNVLGFATIQKTFAALDAEIRHLCQPVSPDFFPLAGDIEDHATNSVYAVQKTEKIVRDLYYILGIEAMHGAQAIDLRGNIRLGVGTAAAFSTIRAAVSFLDKDRNLSRDIESAYGLIKSNEILTSVEKAMDQNKQAFDINKDGFTVNFESTL